MFACVSVQRNNYRSLLVSIRVCVIYANNAYKCTSVKHDSSRRYSNLHNVLPCLRVAVQLL